MGGAWRQCADGFDCGTLPKITEGCVSLRAAARGKQASHATAKRGR